MSNQKTIALIEKDFREWKIADFEKKVWELAGAQTVGNLKLLLRLFKDYDDQCPDLNVMYSVVHAIEKYPADIYVKTLMMELPRLYKQSIFWTGLLFNRIFNGEMHLKIFEKNIPLAPTGELSKLFDLIEKEYPHHADLLARLRQKL